MASNCERVRIRIKRRVNRIFGEESGTYWRESERDREDGVILIADISTGFKYPGKYDMGERVIASPVPVNDRILIQGEKNLLCFGG